MCSAIAGRGVKGFNTKGRYQAPAARFFIRMDKDKLARSAASQWCYCHKCDGVVSETGTRCDKERMHTCRKWYDGYRTAMIALGKIIKDNGDESTI